MIADRRVDDSDARMDLAGRSHACLPLEIYIRVNDRINPNLDIRVDVCGGRIHEGHAGRHQFFVFFLSHEGTYFSEFRPAVDTADLGCVGHRLARDDQVAPTIDRHEICQVILALGILRRD